AKQAGASLLCNGVEHRAAVSRPVKSLTVSAGGRGVIAENSVANIVVVVGGQIARLRVWGVVDDPEIRFRVRPNWLRGGSMESKPTAVRTESEIADSHGDRRELLQFTARRRDGVDVGGRQFVVRLIDAGANEINAPSIERPNWFAFVEVAGGQLHWLGEFIRGGGHVEHPNVAVTLGIQVTVVVTAIDGTGDQVSVGLVLAFRFGLLGLRSVLRRRLFGVFRGRRRFRALLLTLCLGDVLRRGVAQEGDALTVGRPDRIGSTLWKVRDGPSLAPGKGQNCDLRRTRLAGLILVAAAHKGDVAAIRRPARIGIVLPVGHADGRLVAGGGDGPDRSLIAGALFVDDNAGEGHAGAVG